MNPSGSRTEPAYAITIGGRVWTEGFAATLPDDTPTPFEDPVIMSDALLWFAKQSIDYTGKVMTIGELREMGVVRPVTLAKRDASS
jgi:hypothetical protein